MKAEYAGSSWSMLEPGELNDVCLQSVERFAVVADEQALTSASLFYKALADVTRLRVVALLAVTEFCLCQLVDALNVPASTMTHHLQMLERGGVIAARRDGKFTVYSLHPERKEALIQILQSSP